MAVSVHEIGIVLREPLDNGDGRFPVVVHLIEVDDLRERRLGRRAIIRDRYPDDFFTAAISIQQRRQPSLPSGQF